MATIDGPAAHAGVLPDGFHRRLYQVAQSSLSTDTGQTPGMRRVEAISGRSVGSGALWMGQTHVAPSTRSANHHHGRSETGIYVATGHPEFVFLDGDDETRLQTGPGDYVYVPAWVPHREENPDPDDEAIVILARTTQEAIVVNLPDLRWVGPVGVTTADPPAGGDIPIACALGEDAQRHRAEEWATLVAEAVARTTVDGGARLTFAADPATAARVADLAAREQQCCPFLDLTLQLADGGLLLSVVAPPDARAVIDALLGGQ